MSQPVSVLSSGIATVIDRSFVERTSEIDTNRQSPAPPISKTFANGIAEEYDKWFRGCSAGLLSPSPTGLSTLKTALASHKFIGWGAAFSTYWMSTIWIPKGIYTGGITLNGVIVGGALQNEIDRMLLVDFAPESKKTMKDFADRIASILHTYTTKLLVQAALSVPPYTKTEIVI